MRVKAPRMRRAPANQPARAAPSRTSKRPHRPRSSSASCRSTPSRWCRPTALSPSKPRTSRGCAAVTLSNEMNRLRILVFTTAASAWLNVVPAAAWGCEAHQAVAIAAARRLPPATLARINGVLSAARVDPTLRRFCDPPSPVPLADAATWADDVRAIEPATGDWHFINFPRGVADDGRDYRVFCPRGNCIVDAIVAQYGAFTGARDPAGRATALRFITHFVGDLHQPLHA